MRHVRAPRERAFVEGPLKRWSALLTFAFILLMPGYEARAESEESGYPEVFYRSGSSATFTSSLVGDGSNGFLCACLAEKKVRFVVDGKTIPFEITPASSDRLDLEARDVELSQGPHKILFDNGEPDVSFRRRAVTLLYMDSTPPELEIVAPRRREILPSQTAIVLRARDHGAGFSEDPAEMLVEARLNREQPAVWISSSGATETYLVLTAESRRWEASGELDLRVGVQDRAGNASEVREQFLISAGKRGAWNDVHFRDRCRGIVQTVWPLSANVSRAYLVFRPEVRTLSMEIRIEGLPGTPLEIEKAASSAFRWTCAHPAVQVESLREPRENRVRVMVRQQEAVSPAEVLQVARVSVPTRVYLESSDIRRFYEEKDTSVLQVDTRPIAVPILLDSRPTEWADGVRTDHGVFRYVFFPGSPGTVDTAASWVELDWRKFWLKETLKGRYEVEVPISEGIHNYRAMLHLRDATWRPARDPVHREGEHEWLRREGTVLIQQSPPKIASFRYEPEEGYFTATVRDDGTEPQRLAMNLRVKGAESVVPEYDPETFVMRAPFPHGAGKISATLTVVDCAGLRSRSFCEFPSSGSADKGSQDVAPMARQNRTVSERAPHSVQADGLNDNSVVDASDAGLKAYEKGVGLIEDRKYGLAVQCFNHCLSIGDARPEVYRKRGVAYLKSGRIYEAVRDFLKTIDLDPDDSKAYSNMSAAYSMLGDFDRAIEYSAKAIRLDPGDPANYTNRGLAFKNKKQFKKALSDLNHACRIDHANFKTYTNRGTLLSEMGRHQDALKDFNKALDLSKHNEMILANRAMAWLNMGNFQNAIEDIKRSLEINDRQPMAHFSYGNILSEMGSLREAVSHYKKSIELDPNAARVRFSLAKTYDEMEMPFRAVSQYIQCIKIEPKHFNAHNNLGCVYLKMTKYDLAIESFNRAIKLKPDFAWAYNNRGLAWLDKDVNDKAIRDFTKALEYKEFPAAYLNRSKTWKKMRNYRKAILDYDILSKMDPSNEEYLFRIGNLQCKIRQHQEAVSNLTSALSMNPFHQKALHTRAIAFMSTDQYEQAVADFTKLIEINPQNDSAYLGRSFSWGELGDLSKAMQDAKAACRINPYNSMARNRVKKLEEMKEKGNE